MGNSVFPALPGLSWGQKMQPTFRTKIQEAVSGSERRSSMMSYPKWNFQIDFEVLRSSPAFQELQQLVGFFLARQGAFDSFLYSSPADHAVVDQPIGSGNGAAVAYQLIRRFGYAGSSFIEPVQNIAALDNIKVGGSVVSNYSVNGTGLVTFASAPGSGQQITWSGSYYYRCRFVEDAAQFNAFLLDLWEFKSCKFVGSPMNKV
jgi:uncharacterized protein (TIGR02217 family)